MGNKIVKPIPLFNLAASRRTAATNISKKKTHRKMGLFFWNIFMWGW